MRIAHVILPHASEYERKSQRLDLAELAAKHDVFTVEPDAVADIATDVVHLYGNNLAPGLATRIRAPYIASVEPHVGRFRFGFRRPPRPRFIVSPIAQVADGRLQLLPEAVGGEYFEIGDSRLEIRSQPISNLQSPISKVGVFGSHRPGVKNMLEQSLARLQRTRDDVQWRVFDSAPSRDDLRSVDVWVDPATSDADFDGFVAEAIAAGKAVVASRTPINSLRLEKGRTGFLVPPRDPNELTHAILAALFKSEVASSKIEAARQTAGKFRPRQRIRVLERIYETLVP